MTLFQKIGLSITFASALSVFFGAICIEFGNEKIGKYLFAGGVAYFVLCFFVGIVFLFIHIWQ